MAKGRNDAEAPNIEATAGNANGIGPVGAATTKQRIFHIIQSDDAGGAAGRAFGIVLTVIILLNVAAVFISTLQLPGWAQTALDVFDLVSVALFTIDYLLRIWTADLLYPAKSPTAARLRYLFSFMGLIDLLSILPFYLPFVIGVDLRILRLLRIVRLLSVFKLGHFADGLEEIGAVIRARSGQLTSSMLVIGILLVIAALLMYYVEHDAQPESFENAFSALWWAVATLTTVGYGDIYPITALGKLLSAIIAILGVGLVAVPSGIISAGLMELLEKKRARRDGDLS